MHAGQTVQELRRRKHQQFWQKPFAYGNSFGHLVLHLTGNLNITSSGDRGTGYVRGPGARVHGEERPAAEGRGLKRFDEQWR